MPIHLHQIRTRAVLAATLCLALMSSCGPVAEEETPVSGGTSVLELNGEQDRSIEAPLRALVKDVLAGESREGLVNELNQQSATAL